MFKETNTLTLIWTSQCIHVWNIIKYPINTYSFYLSTKNDFKIQYSSLIFYSTYGNKPIPMEMNYEKLWFEEQKNNRTVFPINDAWVIKYKWKPWFLLYIIPPNQFEVYYQSKCIQISFLNKSTKSMNHEKSLELVQF
jgi:hypothetical protein